MSFFITLLFPLSSQARPPKRPQCQSILTPLPASQTHPWGTTDPRLPPKPSLPASFLSQPSPWMCPRTCGHSQWAGWTPVPPPCHPSSLCDGKPGFCAPAGRFPVPGARIHLSLPCVRARTSRERDPDCSPRRGDNGDSGHCSVAMNHPLSHREGLLCTAPGLVLIQRDEHTAEPELQALGSPLPSRLPLLPRAELQGLG